jgi:uncharacterized delta-60 repeat protein
MTTTRWWAALTGTVMGAAVLAGAPPAGAATGPLDPAFGTGGVVVSGPTAGSPVDLLAGPGGSLLVLTSFDGQPGANRVIGVQRHRADGSVDPAYGVGGRATVAFTDFISSPADAALQEDGKLVVVGTASTAQGGDVGFAVARFTAAGAPDPTFGVGGKVTTNILGAAAVGGSSNRATTVVVQPDGKLLVGGSVRECAKARCPTRTALVRYDAAGRLDTSFGTGGSTSAVTPVGRVSALGVDAAGTIAAYGGTAVVELSATGALRTGISHGPLVARSAAGFQTSPITVAPDGGYTVEQGIARPGSPYKDDVDSKVTRFLPSGAVDPTFTSTPFAFVDTGARGNDRAQAILARADGRYVTAGFRNDIGGTSLAVARLGAGGALDATFGTGGRTLVALPAGGHASALAELPDGRVAVAGLAFTEGATDVRLVLVRLAA